MIKSYHNPDELKTASDIAQINHLHSRDGVMRGWFWELSNSEHPPQNPICHIYIYYHHGTPVGILAIKKRETVAGYNCGTYVKEEYRRSGIGTSLISAAMADAIELSPWCGSQSARMFYTKSMNKSV